MHYWLLHVCNTNEHHSCANIKNASKKKVVGVRCHQHSSCAWYKSRMVHLCFYFYFIFICLYSSILARPPQWKQFFVKYLHQVRPSGWVLPNSMGYVTSESNPIIRENKNKKWATRVVSFFPVTWLFKPCYGT